jgi:hypothetical protein
MVLVIARCVSSAGLDCSHWDELVYAWHHAWPAVIIGLGVGGAVAAAGMRYQQLLEPGVAVMLAVVIGFGVYYVSL